MRLLAEVAAASLAAALSPLFSPTPRPPLPLPRPAAILIIFYAAPLSTVMGVLRTRSSATLNLPLSVMNIINGGLW